MECKTTAQVELSVVKGNRALKTEYGDDCVAKALVACRTDRPYPLAENAATEAVPLAGPGGFLNALRRLGRVPAAARDRHPLDPFDA